MTYDVLHDCDDIITLIVHVPETLPVVIKQAETKLKMRLDGRKQTRTTCIYVYVSNILFLDIAMF